VPDFSLAALRFQIIPTLPLELNWLKYSKMAANGDSNGPQTGTGQERINTDIITLTRFLTEEQAKHKEATGDFTSVCPVPSLGFSY